MNNWYGLAKRAQVSGPDRGWVSIDVPAEASKRMNELCSGIPEEDLYTEDGELKFGIEDEHHVTVKWGLMTDDPDEVRGKVEGLAGGKVRLGKTSLFENDDNDVLKVDVESDALKVLNKALSELKNDDSHPVYKPHMTLAYLLPGKGKDWKGLDDLDGLEFDFGEVTFEDADNKKTTIKLEPAE